MRYHPLLFASLCLLVACYSGQETADTVKKSQSRQLEALEKAKAVEQQLQDAVDEKLRKIEGRSAKTDVRD